MAYTTGTFGASGEYKITYPDTDILFVFSPYYIEVEGTSIAQLVTLTYGTTVLRQYTGTDLKCIFPIHKILQSSFKGVDFGHVKEKTVGEHINSGCKLWFSDDELVVNLKVGTDVNDISLNFKLIYGAIQRGEIQKTQVNIYKFGDSLPITISQLIGTRFKNTPNTWNSVFSRGTDIWLNGLSDGENILILNESDEVIKTYIINNLPDCTSDTMYVRWISLNDGYKYYQFRIGKTTEASKISSTFNQNVFSVEPVNGVYRNERMMLSKPTGEVVTIVEPSASKSIVEHIKSIFTSPIVWVYAGNNEWIEVSVSDSELQEVWNGGKREIQINIIMPDKYVQSL